MSRTILVQNEKDTLSTAISIADLRHTVTTADPDFGILNEWTRGRDPATRKMLADLGYGYARPRLGGGPVFWRAKYGKPKIKRRLLSGPGYVGHLPGRRSFLGPNWLTLAVWKDARYVLGGYHLDAEVQDMRGGGGYKTDPAHAPRVKRHRKQKRTLGKIAREYERKGFDGDFGGDSNFAHMKLGGFHEAWDGYQGGDLGGRAVTSVYSTDKPLHRPATIPTRSDHDTVIVTY